MRVFIVAALAASASLLFVTNPSQAAPKIGQRASDCSKWDCSGGIICSCCFNNGCWICDAGVSGPIIYDCDWNDAVRNQGTVPGGSIVPGGGVLDPGNSAKPRLQMPATGGAAQ